MIKKIFKNSFSIIKENKQLSVLLFFTQMIYLLASLAVFTVAFFKIMVHADYLLKNLYLITPEQISANTVNNPLAMYSHYSSLISIFIIMIISCYLLYLIINGANWSITNMIVNKKQKFLRFFPGYAVFALIFTIPLIFITKGFLRIMTTTGIQTQFMILLGIIILVFWYFMTIAFGLAHKYELKQIKQHFLNTFIIGFRKSGVLVPISLFIFVILMFFVAMIYLASDSLALVILLSLAVIPIFVWTRILCMTAVREVSKE